MGIIDQFKWLCLLFLFKWLASSEFNLFHFWLEPAIMTPLTTS
jgi:hypothetical protein